MKKLTVILSMLVIALLCSVSVFAADTDDSGMWEFEAYGDGVAITKYNGTQVDVYVPNRVEKGDTDYSVIKLGDELFKDNTSLNSATLGEGITEIGASVFEGATELVCIVTPESLTTIGANAFSGCTNFNSVVLYDAVTNIGNDVFAECHCITVYCNENSTAHKYVESNDIYYEILRPDTTPKIIVEDGIEYYISNGTVSAVSYDGSVEDVVLPATVYGRPLTDVNTAFQFSTELKSIVIPNSVAHIQSYAFERCSNLVSVELPVGLKTIGEAAFIQCTSLKDIEIPSTVIAIEDFAFQSCESIENIVLPDCLSLLGSYSFTECKSLRNINIPHQIIHIDDGVFDGCSSLLSINIPDNTTYIGSYAFNGCSSLTSLELPENVTFICHGAFRGCRNIESVEIPYSVEVMYPDSFDTNTLMIVYDTSMAYKFVLENDLLHFVKNGDFKPEIYTRDGIKYYIFNNKAIVLTVDSSLVDVEIPETIEEHPVADIRDVFKYHSNIKSVVLPQSLTSIDDYAFYNCSSLMSIKIPNSVTYIGEYALSNCSNLESVEIPASVTTMYSYSFDENVVLVVRNDSPAYRFAIEKNFLYYIKDGDSKPELYTKDGIKYYISNGSAIIISVDSSLVDVVIPEAVERYPVEKIRNAFEYNNKLKSIILPQGLTTIDDYAFSSCHYLESVEIPDSVTYIGKYALSGSFALKSVRIPRTVIKIHADAFSSNATLLVYENSPAHTFAMENNYRYFVIDDNGTTCTINGITYMIENDEATVDLADPSLTDVIIPKTVKGYPVTEIGTAFMNHSKIKSIVLPLGITMINDYAFTGCSNLESIVIPDSVTYIGDYAFYGCALTSIEIPDNVTYVGVFAFEACDDLTDIKISNGMNSIATETFAWCTNLENVVIPKNIVEIGQFSFSNCVKLKNVQIPDGVQIICSYAFDRCPNLKTLLIPKSVREMYVDAFSANTILCVYENSYAHEFAVENNLLYFVIRETSNPEISYGSGISGTVTYLDGTAVWDATVDIIYDDGTVKQSVKTGSDGRYYLTYAEVGKYTIRVTDDKQNTASETVSVKRMNVFDVYITGETDLVLQKGHNVSGTVSPLEAQVTIRDIKGGVISYINTIDGVFSFSDIPRGTYIVRAENGTGSITKEIYVSGDVTGIALEIKEDSAMISGDTRIRKHNGEFVVEFWIDVDLIDADGNVVAQTTTDIDGKYTFKNIPIGSYKIVATTNEMRPDPSGKFDKNYELKGYAHIDITEAGGYTVGTITLREEKLNTATVNGKVTANGTTQDCQVILTNENGDQIAVFVTDNNGKYSFVNIPDGMYCITAITKVDGMGFAVITVEDGVVHGSTDIKVVKSDKILKREATLLAIPECNTKAEALIYKEVVMTEKKFYDELSEKERKQLSSEWIEKLFKLIDLIFDIDVTTPDGVTVDNEESVIPHDAEETSVTFTLTVTETEASDAGDDGINTGEEYETEKIKDKKGKDKKIAKYYDITFAKDGKNISNIQKQTETNGKLRIIMEIPEEYRGHKHYSFIHMHKGEAVTLVDLDDNPNTVTFEIDKFSTFALAYSDTELVGEIEEKTYPASITYDSTTGKISVSSEEAGTLYVATYDGDKMVKVDRYAVEVGTTPDVCEFSENQKAFIWNEYLMPICKKFNIQ